MLKEGPEVIIAPVICYPLLEFLEWSFPPESHPGGEEVMRAQYVRKLQREIGT